MSELYFNRFITDRKDFRFSPYLGFGVGYLINGNIDEMNGYANPAKNRIATIKRLSLKLDVKRVDIEALKAEFAK